jgi:hypothetical protein
VSAGLRDLPHTTNLNDRASVGSQINADAIKARCCGDLYPLRESLRSQRRRVREHEGLIGTVDRNHRHSVACLTTSTISA